MISAMSFLLTPHPNPLPVEGRGGSEGAFKGSSARALLSTHEWISLSPEWGEGSRVRGEDLPTSLFLQRGAA